ncbi:tRNA-dihydrouridine synthase [Granulosicoccaceae sp. 1_MG-2023]|nr:tRNA-dihydrouridine synthase [Granulosicoccaceae sp. 1_MG-2023]
MSISPQPGRILLAPMEGVIDAPMRELLTRLGDYDRCVTEFIRVTDQRLPARVFRRLCPELNNDGRTATGVPVFVQLLGGDAAAMALNAVQAVTLGAPGIDINFGCPAKCVNRNDGGSVLLKEPERIGRIVAAVRDAIPADIPLSVKIRLGFADSAQLEQISSAVYQAGAGELCVHARTREDGYKPPAHWQDVQRVHPEAALPVVINGEIWTPHDAALAQQQSGCQDLMLGRGALSSPDLARRIRALQRGETPLPLPWLTLLPHILSQFNNTTAAHPKYIGCRLKQWLVYLRREYREAADLFARVKRLTDADAIRAAFDEHERALLRGETPAATG